jgi:hypothetical protein
MPLVMSATGFSSILSVEVARQFHPTGMGIRGYKPLAARN